jgi:hypothetical protein
MKYLFLIVTTLSLLSTTHAQKDSTQFVTTWRTYNNGSGGDSSIFIYADTNYVYNYDIDWNDDGVFDMLGVTGSILHRYSDTGTFTVRIKGQFQRFLAVNPSIGSTTVNEKILSINQWGDGVWNNVDSMFAGAVKMRYKATDKPNLSNINSLREMFRNCLVFNGNLNDWDVSMVNDLTGMFEECTLFNQPVDRWDVSRVRSFSKLFAFTSFNFPLAAWQTDSASDMSYLFYITPFNQPISCWNTSKVTDMTAMFGYSKFNQLIDNWDVSSVAYMSAMFGQSEFNQPLNNWDVSSVKRMNWIFENTPFNQPLNNWAVDSVNKMGGMFANSKFNQQIDGWNTLKVRDISFMFFGDSTFNQDLSKWDISSLLDASSFIDNTSMSTQNYDTLLINWSQFGVLGLNFGAKGIAYCNADTVRQTLIDSSSWRFTGDTLDCFNTSVRDISLKMLSSFDIYPNPTSSNLFIETNTGRLQKQEVFIYNMQGQLMYSNTMTQSKQEIDVSGYKSGIYLVRLGNETKRVVVE